MMMNYNEKALQYAEKYGVIEYEVKANEMVYSQWYYGEGTYNCTVNLDTMKETRKLKN